MVFLILESTYTKNILKKNAVFQKDISLFSVKGHLFTYLLEDKKLKVVPLSNKMEIIMFLRNIDKRENTVIIATDQDPAGELIAYEVSSLFEKADVLRFLKPVEELLLEKNITKDFLFKYTTNKINVLKAIKYLQERFFSNYQEEKLKALKILQKNKINRIKKIKKE